MYYFHYVIFEQIHKELYVLSVPKFTANLYCLCISIDLGYADADSVQICCKFWDTQYVYPFKPEKYKHFYQTGRQFKVLV